MSLVAGIAESNAETDRDRSPEMGAGRERAPQVRVLATKGERVLAALMAAGILTVLIVAASLRAEASGMGTHKQLGLPTCGWVAAAGVPCPTCGMTTAFAGMATARPWTGLVAQPMGAVLALVGAAGFWGALHVAVFGSRLGTILMRALQPRLLWVIGALWAASWIYKVLVVKNAAG